MVSQKEKENRKFSYQNTKRKKCDWTFNMIIKFVVDVLMVTFPASQKPTSYNYFFVLTEHFMQYFDST